MATPGDCRGKVKRKAGQSDDIYSCRKKASLLDGFYCGPSAGSESCYKTNDLYQFPQNDDTFLQQRHVGAFNCRPAVLTEWLLAVKP